MPDPNRSPVSFSDTPIFKDWLKQKGYDWNRMKFWEKDNALAECMREGLANAHPHA